MLHHWIPASYSGVVSIYFTSGYVLAGVLLALAGLAASFGIFALSEDRERKSSALLSSIVISTSMWVFVFSSLVFCAVFMGSYVFSTIDAILDVAKFSLVPAVTVGPAVTYFLRNRSMKKIYPYFITSKTGSNLKRADVPQDGIVSRAFSVFSTLLYSAKLSGVSLSIVPASDSSFPASAAMDWRGEKVVAISSMTLLALDDEELKAVLAHELGHIAHRDSFRKTFATAYRSAFIFDPVAHFVEAAIYRDGELYADEYSARLTGKPAALASALIKIHESMSSPIASVQSASLLLNRKDSGIFSKEPSLSQRIKRLLEMQDREIEEEEKSEKTRQTAEQGFV